MLQLCSLVSGNGFQITNGDDMPAASLVLDSFGLGIGAVVQQNATAHHPAAVVPVVNRREILALVVFQAGFLQILFGKLRAVVGQTRGLVRKVQKPIPLTGRLCVERDMVVSYFETCAAWVCGRIPLRAWSQPGELGV
jgi:hypothetical protein